MKERPILFGAPMVRALLAGRKTQTRRAMRPQPPAGWFSVSPDEARGDGESWDATPRWLIERCPYGTPGDRLWVREAVACTSINKRPPPHDDDVATAVYEADGSPCPLDRWPWRRFRLPGIFMPYGLHRITVEITNVRVQRLNEISEDDARAEGVERDTEPCDHTRSSCEEIGCLGPTYRSTFCERWESINGKRTPWSDDPWVWALTFKRRSE